MICRSNTWVGTIVTVSSLRKTLGRQQYRKQTMWIWNICMCDCMQVSEWLRSHCCWPHLLFSFFFWCKSKHFGLMLVFQLCHTCSLHLPVKWIACSKASVGEMCIDVLNKQLCSPGNAMLWSLFRHGRHVMLFPFVVLLGGAVLEQPTVGSRPVNTSLE